MSDQQTQSTLSRRKFLTGAAAATGAATLAVNAPNAVRGGLLYQTRFTIVAHQELKDATLVLNDPQEAKVRSPPSHTSGGLASTCGSTGGPSVGFGL